ncbi:MAG TPA: hypothetical protein VFT69_05010 [Pseudolabrys sp.]|nr:hypothetical protein [Pseudolabrys sp.]
MTAEISWRKLGLLYAPEGRHPKLATHAANPMAVPLEDDVFRVFFSGRDAQNRSSVGCVDIDIVRRKVLRTCDAPVFEHGRDGSFYSHGVSLGNWYIAGGRAYVTFMGWQRPPGGHWRGDIGRLIMKPDYSLVADGQEPFMGADETDPVSLSYPWVVRHLSGYRMWYGSTVTWDAGNGEMLHVIQYATSHDGHVWNRHGPAVPHEIGTAQAFSRPAVLLGPDARYHMWFSFRSGAGETYRIGYAVSGGGKQWELRLGQSGIAPSSSGWDSEMIEYPFVFEHAGEWFMLYNGNGYGETGFGLAVLEVA